MNLMRHMVAPCMWIMATGALLAAPAAFAPPAFAQEGSGILFPRPFMVEQLRIDHEADGSAYSYEPAVTYYGGSFIVSHSADGARRITDFERRELIDVAPRHGTYCVLSFTEYADLARRLARAELEARDTPGNAAKRDATGFEIDELPLRHGLKALGDLDPEVEALLGHEGVRHFRAVRATPAAGEAPAMSYDAWVDPRIRFSARARSALEDLEVNVLGAAAELRGREHLTGVHNAVRRDAGGAFATRTVTAVPTGDPSAPLRFIEIRTVRVDTEIVFPAELVEVAEGLVRARHPLEAAVEFEES